METLPKVRSLASFLRTNQSSIDEIMQFVALNTLDEFSVMTAFLATVKHDGLVTIIAKYGCTEEGFASIPDRQVSVDIPVNRALRTGTIVECGSSEEYLYAAPGYQYILFPNGFAYSVAFPVPGIGSVVIYCAKPIELEVEVEEFFLVVGGLISMEVSRVRRFDVDREPTRISSNVPAYGLTSRQWKVFEAIQSGLSNSQISDHLGLSEVLVRQDVTKIMANLGASERAELLHIQGLDREDREKASEIPSI